MVEYQQSIFEEKRIVEMMRYIPQDKYTIAWFKLAECVAKGEKEKAFGVYRLLMHSLEDQAYAHQLEGDLLCAFQDERASEKYAHAAHLYFQNRKFKESAALYEELIFLVPDNNRYLSQLIAIYKEHKNIELFKSKMQKLLYHLLEQSMYSRMATVIDEIKTVEDAELILSNYQHLIERCIHDHTFCPDKARHILYDSIDFILKRDDSLLTNYLAFLEQSSGKWHAIACDYLKK